jgi:hypothetical protein
LTCAITLPCAASPPPFRAPTLLSLESLEAGAPSAHPLTRITRALPSSQAQAEAARLEADLARANDGRRTAEGRLGEAEARLREAEVRLGEAARLGEAEVKKRLREQGLRDELGWGEVGQWLVAMEGAASGAEMALHQVVLLCRSVSLPYSYFFYRKWPIQKGFFQIASLLSIISKYQKIRLAKYMVFLYSYKMVDIKLAASASLNWSFFLDN